MGIKFECVHCGHGLHVKDFLAGKRGICPHCQGRIDIPDSPSGASQADDGVAIAVELPASKEDMPARGVSSPPEMGRTAGTQDQAAISAVGAAAANVTTLARPAPVANVAPGDPIAEGPQLQWYVLPAGSITKYGPAPGDMMRTWLSEGRISAESLVWREGWSVWRPAISVFPQLSSPSASGHTVAPAPEVAPQLTPASPAVDTPAVVLTVDDSAPAPVSQQKVTRRPASRRARDQRNLAVGLLAALVALLLPVLIYVLMHQ